MRHAIKVDAGLNIVLKFVLQVAANVPLKEGEMLPDQGIEMQVGR